MMAQDLNQLLQFFLLWSAAGVISHFYILYKRNWFNKPGAMTYMIIVAACCGPALWLSYWIGARK